mmetsp:Transcript_7744/g.9674  ORF Transcript_7744/g.9674 Transcript_7744/m.9674 type:complete len:389 (+) Transcript_7744:99-1265(+)
MAEDNVKQSSSSLSNSSNSNATAAQHILLSPDGYYTYLQIPKQPIAHKSLLSEKGSGKQSTDSAIDKSKIEKNYRRLSLKLHPDRPGGDAETFRMLERAKCVLMSDKLRKEYDLLGLDLEEEEHHADGDQDGNDDGEDEKKADGGASSSPDSVMSHMASATVAGILQLAVRTAMMAFVSLFITRFKYVTIPAVLFLLYTAFQINKARSSSSTDSSLITKFDVSSPMIIATGLMLMYYGRRTPAASDESSDNHHFWTWTFWCGEALVMAMFALNTIAGKENSALRPSLPLGIGFYVISTLICLWIRGKAWRYATLLGLEMGLALMAVMIFPIMEMILEEIMNEKLKKVGDKVRLYAKVMEERYQVTSGNGGVGIKSNDGLKQNSQVELD